MHTDPFDSMRREMVEMIALYVRHGSDNLGKADLDPQVMDVIGRIPRHEFVPSELRPFAYFDGPLPIGFDKTISQPFMVALMTDLLQVATDDSVLEVGTGLGYHAAILAELARAVYTVEIIEELAAAAQRNLNRLGYAEVEMRVGDGSRGWPEHAPFDRILVCAAPELIPASLLTQLKPGGRMVIPTGLADSQQLTLVEKDARGKVRTNDILPVRFSALETYH